MAWKTRKKLGWGIAIVAGLLLCGGYLFYRWKKSALLSDGLPGLVSNKTDSLFKISYDSIYLNEAKGNVFISNLSVIGDTAQQLQKIANGDTNTPKVLPQIFIPQLTIEGFKTVKALLGEALACKLISIQNPTITIQVFAGQGNEAEMQQQLYKQLLGKFDNIHADSIVITNAIVRLVDFYGKTTKLQLLNTSLSLSHLAIDSVANMDTSRIFFCKKIQLTARKLLLGDDDKQLMVKDVSFDTQLHQLMIGAIAYNATKDNGFFTADVQQLVINGLVWKGPMEQASLAMADISLGKADIALLPHDQSAKRTSAKPLRILKGWIKSVDIGRLRAGNVTFKQFASQKDKQPVNIHNNLLTITRLHIDTTALYDAGLIRQAREMELSNNEIIINSRDGFYAYRIKGFAINSLSRQLRIKSLAIVPKFSEAAFAQKARYQKDRFNVVFTGLNMSNLGIPELLEGKMQAGNVAIAQGSIRVYHDLTYPIDSIRKASSRQSFPHQLLQKIDLPVRIGRLSLNDAYIEYKEKEIISGKTGIVHIHHANLIVSNISNGKHGQGDKMVALFKASFLNQVPMSGNFTFYMNEWQQGKFSVNVNTGTAVDATVFSSLTEPMALARVERGSIGPLSFHMLADSIISNGTLTLPYEDVKLSLLSTKNDQYKKKQVLSFLANLVVRNSNQSGKKVRTANVSVERNVYKSFFNFIWLTMFKGLRQTMLLKL